MTDAVREVRTRHVPLRSGRAWDVVLLRTEHGISGYGEASDAGGAPGPEFTDLTRACLGAGVDAALDTVTCETRRLVDHLPPGPARLHRLTWSAGLESALCDASARAAALPLVDWLGGPAHTTAPGGDHRFRIPVYANINRAVRARTPGEFGRVARRAVRAGFRAVKCAPFDALADRPDRAELGLELARAVRAGIGPDVELMLDVHEHLTPAELTQIAGPLAELGLSWLEDAAPLHDLDRLAAVKEAVGAPLAGGERLATPDEALPAVTAGLCDVVLPDVTHCGGIRRAVELAERLGAAGARIAPHNPGGPVATAAGAHVCHRVGAALLEYAVEDEPLHGPAPARGVRSGGYVCAGLPGLGLDLAPHDASDTVFGQADGPAGEQGAR